MQLLTLSLKDNWPCQILGTLKLPKYPMLVHPGSQRRNLVPKIQFQTVAIHKLQGYSWFALPGNRQEGLLLWGDVFDWHKSKIRNETSRENDWCTQGTGWNARFRSQIDLCSLDGREHGSSNEVFQRSKATELKNLNLELQIQISPI